MSKKLRVRRRTMTEESSDSVLSEEEVERVTIMSEGEDSGISELGPEEHTNPGTKPEKLCTVLLQVGIPFVIAGFGMMAAGLLLDAVQHWTVYQEVNEIFILVPALLGLKGNLEMTLASRLSTAANLGQLDSWANRFKLGWGNLALIQAQALVVAGLATVFSLVLGRDLEVAHQLMLGASAMGAASVASVILGSIMILVIILSHSLSINPDNVATPIAAALGDLVTLGLLSLLARGLYDLGDHTISAATTDSALSSSINVTLEQGSVITASSCILVGLIVLIPLWMAFAYRNTSTRAVLFIGWVPVIVAMLISSSGGWVLSFAVNKWKGIAVYSPIINGVGGNLAAVQASRISTSLHQTAHSPGQPLTSDLQYKGPCSSFFSKQNIHARTARILISLVIPGSIVFLSVIQLVGAGHTTQSYLFVVGYMVCALIQVVLLLLIADWGVHKIWSWGYDPDNIAIPFLTALGDLLGTGLLTLGFWLMWLVGDKDDDVGD
ncbi:solute carrier family 41 member 1-like isoform X2 [Halichondria panicea]|uniref:solute carrier family 41 member 1-like isoform X2 n=1 Tax=Halichondria panicea TaxID=6063 RepID=UPI00312B5EB3